MKTWLVLGLVCLGCAGSSKSEGEPPTEIAGTGGVTGTAGTAGTAGAGVGGVGGAGAGGVGGAGVGGVGGAGVGGVGRAGAGGVGGAAGSPGGVGVLRDFLGDPAYPDSFWQPATFADARVDQAQIDAALARIATSGWELHSLLVARDGKLVVERYGWDQGLRTGPPAVPHQVLPSEPHPLFSSTKSVLSALYGIALDAGLIGSVQLAAVDWFPDYAELNPSAEKATITLEDLFTMRSGLDVTEPEPSLEEVADPAREVLSRAMVSTPGETWNYSSGNSEVLAEILRLATGVTPLAYANEKLFAPLGIRNPTWLAGKNGTEHGGFGLSLTSRDMARFGELYRNGGSWLGTPVVPAAWVDASTLPRCASAWGGQYAYHWWVPQPELPGFINTLGAFGQYIYVSRDLGLVIVVTGDRPNDTSKNEIQGLIGEFIVPAMH